MHVDVAELQILRRYNHLYHCVSLLPRASGRRIHGCVAGIDFQWTAEKNAGAKNHLILDPS